MLNNIQSPVTHSIYRSNLKQKIVLSQRKIRENNAIRDAKIIRRTEAMNNKRDYQTQTEEQAARQDVVAEQRRAWRRVLPVLI